MTAADTIKEIEVKVKRCPECGARFGVDAAFCPFDGLPLSTSTWDPTANPLKGKIVDGRYEILEPLGEGGMGTVYKVRHVTLDRLFAMKVLRRDLASDADLAARFVQEAKATAAVKHPSVVAITDFGELEDGVPYFVMELLSGETLATRMRGRGPMAPETATKIARKIAEALEASHAANVIHRDLKPENVFLVGAASGKAAEDEIRIVDFGAAKVVGASKLTRPGIVFGTPYYMSPEQASGQTIDGRADVYSLGVLLYEMITGAVPFEADTYMGVLTKHMFASPAKPSERVPAGIELGALESIVLSALEKDPSARFASMGAFARALERAEREGAREGKRRSDAAVGRSVAPMGLTTADRIQLSVTRRVQEETRRRRRLVAISGMAAFGTFVLGATIAALATNDPAPRAPPSAVTTPAASTVTPTNASTVASAPASSGAASASGAPEPKPEPSATDTSATSLASASAPLKPSEVAPRPPSPAVGRIVDPRPRPTTKPSAAPAPSPTRTIRPSDEFKDPWAH